MAKTEIRIIDHGQSRKPPIWRGLSVCAALSSILFGPGVIAGSAAMQWAGFILLLVLVLLCALAYSVNTYTIDEARQKLDELEAEIPY